MGADMTGKTQRPLVSIVVPVYNIQKHLDTCVEHLVDQTYENIEIILVDDGSTDQSGAMCDTWALKDTRIRVIHQLNSGPASARNNGLRAAIGSFVAFLDGDDFCDVLYIETLLHRLIASKTDLACCSYDRLDVDGQLHDVQHIPVKDKGDSCLFLEYLLLGKLFPAPWGKMLTSKLAQSVWFDENVFIGEDARMWTNLLSKADEFSFCSIDSALYHYRENDEGIMERYHADREHDIIDTWEAMCQMASSKFGERLNPAIKRCRAWMWFEVLDRAIRHHEENHHEYCDDAVQYLKAHANDISTMNELSKRRKLGVRLLTIGKPLYAFYRRQIAK